MSNTELEKRLQSRHDMIMGTYLKQLGPMLMTSAVAGIILAILAPYSTDQFAFTSRLLFWTGMCIAGGFGAWSFQALWSRTGKTLNGWQEALGLSLGATLMVAVFFVILGLTLSGLPRLTSWPLLLFYIWVISIIISGIGTLIGHARSSPTETRPAIYDRLKPALRNADIYALSAEDHYVRVITSKGDDLILMRLTDAIKEVSPLPGLSPHRSWWIAEAGVKEVSKSQGKLNIVLKNGSMAPVSRNKHKIIRDAGWA